MHRIFLLSPAHVGGRRAALVFNPRAGFALARDLQNGRTRPLGEIFQFLSGLYFRGKLAYATAFAHPPPGAAGVYVITSNRGLLPTETPTTLEQLRSFLEVPIDVADPRYRTPLQTTTRVLAASPDVAFILLGSISTAKYAEPLLEVLGERLLFPAEFIGRGDMSRGGLMLRCARDGHELTYQRVLGAARRGTRPPRLPPTSWRGTPWAQPETETPGIRRHRGVTAEEPPRKRRAR